jgi:hypothetical protein
MDFCRPAAARTTDGLILRPLFLAPLAERCALTAELSIIVSDGGSEHSTSASNIRCQRPRWLHRLYRLKTVIYGPYSSGSARPPAALAKTMDDAAEDAPIMFALRSGVDHRKMRLDRRPLLIAEPEIVCHESSPPNELESRRYVQFNWVHTLFGKATASAQMQAPEM